ncbi:translation initiation factor 2 [Pseudomonas caspiana]|uniref:translation initiation factor 2 n=1 Tax=Pseudomonas caspiana TaxID=1451454 RepID=UPI0032EF8C79
MTAKDGASASGKPKAEATKTPATKTVTEKKRDAVARKSVAESKKALKDTSLNNAKLDLSLPPELAEELQPAGTTKAKPRKPILPPMFGDKRASGNDPFELNGRILSNEMDLQMRNDSRREVEGAALDFKFRQ